jgi:hypothetical protein
MLLQSNATVSTKADGTVRLSGVRALIDQPTEKDQLNEGGIVRLRVLLDPATDIAAGDILSIDAWGQHGAGTPAGYHVNSAEPEGSLGLEVTVVLVGDAIGR